jgi:hypothetical protein
MFTSKNQGSSKYHGDFVETSSGNDLLDGTDNDLIDISENAPSKSWIWKWAKLDKETNKVFCTIKGCDKARVGFVYSSSNTSTVARHLKNKHGIDKDSGRSSESKSTTGPLEASWAKQSSKRPWQDEWEERICKFVVCNQQPYRIMENKEFQDLILTAHKAPTTDSLRFMSKDTVARKVHEWHDVIVFIDRVILLFTFLYLLLLLLLLLLFRLRTNISTT